MEELEKGVDGLVNVHVVRVDEAENARLFGIAQRSVVFVSLSPELVKSVVELSGGKVAPILGSEKVRDGAVQTILWTCEEFYDNAQRALLDAIRNAVIKKLERESEFQNERVMTLDKRDVLIVDYILALEESAKKAEMKRRREEIKMKMKEICETRKLEYIDGYNKFIVVLRAHNNRREIYFDYDEESLHKLQTLDVKQEMIELLNEIISELKKENEELREKLIDYQDDETGDENDE